MSEHFQLQGKDCLQLQGEMSFASVVAILAACTEQLKQLEAADITLDFSLVQVADSSVLTFLMSLRRFIKASGKTLHLQHPPAKMQAIMRVVAIDGWWGNF